ncbi:MAG: hypothetical protein OEM52_15160 [bacterium]|nr:hypothetical protein [bacterium]
MSAIGDFLWMLLPGIRKQKDTKQSVLYGLLTAIGELLDDLKSDIRRMRLSWYAQTIESGNSYYQQLERSNDLDEIALGKSTRRYPDESNELLADRLTDWTNLCRWNGTKPGLKTLIESHGFICREIVESYADSQGLILLSRADQPLEAEINLTHLFSSGDAQKEEYQEYRQNRVYRASELVWNFCFAVSVGRNGLPEHRREQLQQAIYEFKPAHTRAQIVFMD